MSVNKVILVGRLGADPELSATSIGEVANFSVATDRKWRNRDGDLESETQWTRVVVFGRLAAACGKNLVKGQQVYVEGRLKTSSWDDPEGIRRWKTEVVAREVVFLARARAGKPKPPEEETAFGDDDLPF